MSVREIEAGTGTIRAALYYRVSTPGQVDAFGYDVQKRELPKHAAAMGWQVAGEYEEPGVSGSTIPERPAMVQLLKDAQAGKLDVILAIHDTRFSRGDLTDWQYIKAVCDRSEVSLATPQGTFYRPNNDDDDFTTDIRGAVAKRERKDLAKKLRAARREAVEQGLMSQAAAPYGYTFERLDRGGARKKLGSYKRLAIVPEQAEVVELVFRLAAHGLNGRSLGVNRICHHLNEELKIPATRGGKWQPQVVNRMLRHPIYRGEWLYEDRQGVVSLSDPETVPPIVSPDLWQAAQAGMEHRKRYDRGRPAATHPRGLLTSLVHCPCCGYRFHHHQTQRGRRWYICKGRENPRLIGRTDRCPAPRWDAEQLEASVWALLLKTVSQPELLREMIEAGEADAPPVEGAELEVIRRGLAALQAGEENVRAALRRGSYSPEEFDQEIRKVRQERADLEGRLARLQGDLDARGEWEEQVLSAIDLLKHYQAWLPKADHEGKRRVLCDLVEKITLKPDGSYTLALLLGTARPGRVGCEVSQVLKDRRHIAPLPVNLRGLVSADPV